jgi:prepilin-type processing-associated H-X9-DG protein
LTQFFTEPNIIDGPQNITNEGANVIFADNHAEWRDVSVSRTSG